MRARRSTGTALGCAALRAARSIARSKENCMITISAMKWAPPFAAGNVRDHRARWILNEVDWPYRVQLIDASDLTSSNYRAKQPFGQVPYMEEPGRARCLNPEPSSSMLQHAPGASFHLKAMIVQR